MIGDKKVIDLQLYTEAMAQAEDLNDRKRGNFRRMTEHDEMI